MDEETHSFIEDGQKHMQCKSCYDYRPVDDGIVAFTCDKCTMIRVLKRTPLVCKQRLISGFFFNTSTLSTIPI